MDMNVLSVIFDTLYFASLRTEEGEAVRCQLVYLDPANPDPDPPERIVKDRWEVTSFATPVQLTVANLVKLAKATDPRTSSFAVHPRSGTEIEIWGLVDQGGNYHDFINFDTESGSQPPGVFLASIEGLARLKARIRFETIAELRIERIVQETVDVFEDGPVRSVLQPSLDAFGAHIRNAVGDEIFERRSHWITSLESDWIQTLCRLLLRARRYGHGGALLVTPDDSLSELNIKHAIEYNRLRTSLDDQAQATVLAVDASDEISDIMESEEPEMPVLLYLENSVEESNRDDSRSALDGAIWFVSLLTRVDGLVLLTPDLAVRGFGVEITSSDAPTTVLLALDPHATQTSPIEYTRWGTRHRSMMRYCWKTSGSVGFVLYRTAMCGSSRVLPMPSWFGRTPSFRWRYPTIAWTSRPTMTHRFQARQKQTIDARQRRRCACPCRRCWPVHTG